MDMFFNDKIYIDESKHNIFVELTTGEEAPFLTMKDAFLAAACIGYNIKNPQPLNKKKDIFSKNQFKSDRDKALVFALAIARTEDIKKALENPLSLVEELANGGIEELYRMVKKNGGDGIGNLVEEIILEYS